MKKNKFFNNSTKGNDTQNQSSKSKRKFLKTFSFSALAVIMGTAGMFAFAPLGASPSVASANEMVDQVNTKADGENIKYAPSALGLDPENDPVIYTTESGLEIKYGGAATALGGGNEQNDFAAAALPSGKPLSGYPYFTMGTYSGYAVNWVIIGKSTTGLPTGTTSTGNIDYNYEKLSTWQGKTSESPTYKHFFEQTYEATTPAGAAIKNSGTLNNYAARKIEYMFNPSILSSVVSNAEITSGCVLAISEQVFNISSPVNSINSSNYEGSSIQSYHEELYESGLGLTPEQQNIIIPQTLNNIYYYANTSTSTNQHIFAMAYRGEKYTLQNYLTTQALRVANSGWYLRSGWNQLYSADNRSQVFHYATAEGGWSQGCYFNNPCPIRPACVISLV